MSSKNKMEFEVRSSSYAFASQLALLLPYLLFKEALHHPKVVQQLLVTGFRFIRKLEILSKGNQRRKLKKETCSIVPWEKVLAGVICMFKI